MTTNSEDWDLAEKRTKEVLGPYPHSNIGLSIGLVVIGYAVGTVALALTSTHDDGLAAMLIGIMLGGGHYAWGALRRQEHSRNFLRNLKAIQDLRAITEQLDRERYPNRDHPVSEDEPGRAGT